MADLEHEEWLRDRATQQNPLKKHIVVGGLQTDVPEDENRSARTDTPDADEEDDDDESENNDATGDDTSDT